MILLFYATENRIPGVGISPAVKQQSCTVLSLWLRTILTN